MNNKYKNIAIVLDMNIMLEDLIYSQKKNILRKFSNYLLLLLSCFGFILYFDIDTNILGRGIITYNNSVYTINSSTTGKINYYDLSIGSKVAKGKLLYSVDVSEKSDRIKILESQIKTNMERVERIKTCSNFIKDNTYRGDNNKCVNEIREKINNHIALKDELYERIKASNSLLKEIELINDEISKNVSIQDAAHEYKIISSYDKNSNTISLKSRDLDLKKMVSESNILISQQKIIDTELSLYLNIKERELEAQQHTLEDKANQLRVELLQLRDELKKSKVFSGIDGTVTNLSEFGLGTNVTLGDYMLSLQPNNSDEAIIIAEVPLKESAWLSADQEAIISLINFPKVKYGYLVGKVKSFYFKKEHYEVVISITENNLSKNLPEGVFQVNSPVSVHFDVGTRKLYEYIFGSVVLHLDSAMNEPFVHN